MPPVPVPLSAPTPRHLQAQAAALARAIDEGALGDHTVAEIAAALALQRDHHEHRAVIIARNTTELSERLACLADGCDWPQAERHAPPGIIRGTARPGRKLCFTMTGQGGQWWAMGRELIEREPVFRATIEQFDDVFRPIGGWSVIEVLRADEAASRIDDAAITPAVMFAFQTALAEVWRARGVAPDIVLGHSFGEVTAAYLAGGLEAREIARLVDQRGLIRHAIDRVGTMAAIGLGAAEIGPLLPADGSIEIGGYNAPAMVTLTGEEAAIDALIARLNTADPTILTRKLALDFAYHSSWFEPVEQIFKEQVGALRTAPPRLPVVSTVTGRLNDRFDADYWWQNLRRPVRYSQAIETALDLGADVFVELGPHRTLSSMTAACAAAKDRAVVTVTSLDRRWGDLVSLAVATGQLWAAGVDIDWAALTGGHGRDVELPPQPWLSQPLWLEPDEAAAFMRPAFTHPLLGRRDSGPGHAWAADISLATHAWLGDHRLDGACVFPAAAYLEMLAVAAQAALGATGIELAGVSFPAALFIGSDDEVQLATRYMPELLKLTIHSRVRGGEPEWTLRAMATAFPCVIHGRDRDTGAVPEGTSPCPSRLDLPAQAADLDVEGFYASAQAAGYGWGRQFRGLTGIRRARGVARGEIALPATESEASAPFLLDPRVIDSALQLMLASGEPETLLGVMPAGIARVLVTGSPGHSATAIGRTQEEASGDGITADIAIASASGDVAVEIRGLRARRRHLASDRVDGNRQAPRLYREDWEAVDLAAQTQQITHWVVLARPGCPHGKQLAPLLCARDGECEMIEWLGDGASAVRALSVRLGTHEPGAAPLGIAYAVPLSAQAIGEDGIAPAAIEAAAGIIALGRALVGARDRGRAHLTVLTLNARIVQAADIVDDAGLAQSPVLAAARTIALELPEIGVRMIDGDVHALARTDVLIAALRNATQESELALRDDRTYAARIAEPGSDGPLPPKQAPIARTPAADFVLRHEGASGAEGLHWREAAHQPIGPGDVEVEVAAVGLNFRDLMAVTGVLPAGAEPGPAIDALGLELSGIVRRIGKDVRDLAPGDDVMGMGRGVLRRFAVLPRAALHRVPAGLSHAQAATIPSAFMTANFSLNEAARIRPGETVLIHSATGGLGLAAIALARRARARIIATAGTPDKRAHLHALGIEHVFDSRSLGFADDVMRATRGRGVDVVLNSLSGPFIAKGLACVAPYGRFIELGKRDIHDDTGVGLKALKAGISFHVVDLAALIVDRPETAARLLAEVSAMLATGEIAPLPLAAFDAARVADAFRSFAAARHIGKLVVDLAAGPGDVRTGLAHGAPLDPDGTYLVTGGTRGFGRAAGAWLAARGAGRVVVAGRGELAPFATGAAGCSVERLRLDVTVARDVEAAIARLASSDKPLRGIVHAAVVYDDALLADMDAARVSHVMAPKVIGALNLTRAVERVGARLDHFATFSSLAQTVGWPGQSSYAAANGFLEALAHWQRRRGIPGQCIIWGALGESGHVSRSEQMQSYLASSGWIAISDAAALDALARALDTDLPVLTVAAADWQRLAATHPALGRSPRLSRLLAEAGRAGAADRALSRLEGSALAAAALELVMAQTARVLRARTGDLSADQTLADAGIDSLSAFELHNRIVQAAGIDMPMARYAKARRIGELASLLATLATEAKPRK